MLVACQHVWWLGYIDLAEHCTANFLSDAVVDAPCPIDDYIRSAEWDREARLIAVEVHTCCYRLVAVEYADLVHID